MSNRALILIFIMIVLGGAYVLYTYYYAENPKEIVIIYPDPTPTKIKPKEAGGVVVANTGNIVYENLKQQKGKQDIILQAEPEKPLNLVHQPVHGDENTDQIDDILSGIVETDYAKYQKHKNTNKTSDETILPENIKGQTAQKEEEPEPKNTSEEAGLNIKKVTETRNKAYKSNLTDSQAKGSYKIQLASVKSLSEAEKELERIKKKYSKVLSKSKLTIKKIQYSKANIFYIILAGEYKNAGEAKSICKKLSDNSQGCIISK